MRYSVSIIMAVYNTAPYLDKCLQSIITQTYLDWELICVDDGSTDNSFSILSAYKDKDNRIKVIQIPHCGVHAKVMNIAMQYVTGDYVYSIDSDDYMSADLLSKLYNKIIQEKADLALPDMIRVDKEGNILSQLKGCCGKYDVVLTGKEALVYSLNWQIHSLGLWKSDIFRDITADEEGFSLEYTSRERFLQCNRIVFDDACYYYVQHSNSITQRIGPRKFYYVMLDVKVLELLKRNNFPVELLLNYNMQCMGRLMSKLIDYFVLKNQLTKEEQAVSYNYLKTAYRYQLTDTSLYYNTIRKLSFKKRMIMKVASWSVFVLYCKIKSIICRWR